MVRVWTNASWVVITCALHDYEVVWRGREPTLVSMTEPLCIEGWQQTSHNPILDCLTNRAKSSAIILTLKPACALRGINTARSFSRGEPDDHGRSIFASGALDRPVCASWLTGALTCLKSNSLRAPKG